MTSPTILAFDTSGPHCAVALLMGGNIVARRFEEMQKGQAERLMPLVEAVMGEVGAVWEELDAIAVGTGPGNFTGVRIAVSAARGLALARGIPAVGVSSFEIAARTGFWAKTLDPQPEAAGAVRLPGPRTTQLVQDMAGGAMVGPPRTEGPFEDRHDAPECEPLDWAGDGLSLLVTIAEEKWASGMVGTKPAPLYVRPADAAPPSDPPPVILDA